MFSGQRARFGEGMHLRQNIHTYKSASTLEFEKYPPLTLYEVRENESTPMACRHLVSYNKNMWNRNQVDETGKDKRAEAKMQRACCLSQRVSQTHIQGYLA
jgi:hypothetical protein